jgi:sterol desaturase/sphingolipid hydroxylase (fatty acid hydroxylase superfamily)
LKGGERAAAVGRQAPPTLHRIGSIRALFRVDLGISHTRRRFPVEARRLQRHATTRWSLKAKLVRGGRMIFEYGFCPAVLVFCVFATWYARRHGIGWMKTLFFSSVAPVLILTVFEHIQPFRVDWNHPFRTNRAGALRELGKDLVYMLVITRIHSFLLPTILPLLVPHAKAFGKAAHVYGAISPMHPALRIAIILMVGELFWYWGHRLQHHVGFFWRFHATHHFPERLSALKASRNHPADMLFLTIIGYLPLVALGARGNDLMWAALIQSIVNVTSHANVRVRGGLYGLVFATPDYHRVHHSEVLEESRTNYGCRLLLWDHLFGTFRVAGAQGDRITVGVRPLGGRTFFEELVDPFRVVTKTTTTTSSTSNGDVRPLTAALPARAKTRGE